MATIDTPTLSQPITADEQLRTAVQHRYLDTYARLAANNRHLRFAVFTLSLVVLGVLATHVRTLYLLHHLKPLVIRIDDIGRAQAIQYDAATYSPREPELRHFLAQFVTLHFSRMRATLKRDYANSLMFLDASLADAAVATQRDSQALEKFLASADAEIEIEVRNVALQEIRTPPYRATVDYDRVYFAPNTRRELRRDRYTGTFDFVVADVPNSFIQVNPLGLLVTYFREDQAFAGGS